MSDALDDALDAAIDAAMPGLADGCPARAAAPPEKTVRRSLSEGALSPPAKRPHGRAPWMMRLHIGGARRIPMPGPLPRDAAPPVAPQGRVSLTSCSPAAPPVFLSEGPLPPRAEVSTRNISAETRRARQSPQLLEALALLERAHADRRAAQELWEQRTSGLAVGGQVTSAVENRTAAVARAENELEEARAALEKSDTGGRPVARTRLEQAERRLDRERRALSNAEFLASLATEIAEQDARLKEVQRNVDHASKDLLRLEAELQEARSSAAALPGALVAAVRADPDMEQAENLVQLEGRLRVELCLCVRCAGGAGGGASDAGAGGGGGDGTLALDPAVLVAALDEGQEGEAEPLVADAAEVLVVQTGSRSSADAEEPGAARRCIVLVDAESEARLRAVAKQPCRGPRSLPLLRGWLGLDETLRLDADVGDALGRLLRPPESLPIPEGLYAELRPYQGAGFRWLAANASAGLGSVLADDMGLGKTLQSLALLLHLKQTSVLVRPCLIVLPLSVLGNWRSEIARFAPSLRCHVYHGPGRRLPANCFLPSRTTTDWGKMDDGVCEQEDSTGDVPSPSGSEGEGQEAEDTKDVAMDGLEDEAEEPPLPPSATLAAPAAEIVLTTYAVVQRDWARLSECRRFDAIILDESQAIKNSRSRTSLAVKHVANKAVGSTGARVALTGTPVENRLSELHAIFSFAMPELFGPLALFEAEFSRILEQTLSSGQNDQDADVHAATRDRLLGALRPFVLRRCKADVAKDLPPKIDVVHKVELTAAQRRLYEAILQGGHFGAGPAEGSIAAKEEDGQQDVLNDDSRRLWMDEDLGIEVLDPVIDAMQGSREQQRRRFLLHGLQQACNHPMAVGEKHWPVSLDRDHDVFGLDADCSGKLARLLELVEEILQPPCEKVLIFTQYRETQNILVEKISLLHPDIDVLALHGGLEHQERDMTVRMFQEDPACCVFVATLGAGGVGLNLTAAAHVIHFDRCWNPAKEAQATDRAHRIGQRQSVVVHKLITSGTLEERIAERLAKKAELAQEVIPVDITGSLSSMTRLELEELLALRQ